MSRLAIFGPLLVMTLGACGADSGGAGLSQLTGGDALSLADGAEVTSTEDTTVGVDTIVGEDSVAPTDTVTPTDTVVTGCQQASDCVELVSPGLCERAACVDQVCVVEANDGAMCDDGDPCTRSDVCQGGVCLPGAELLPCNDQNACTSDGCVAGEGCVFTPVTCATPGDPCKVAKCDPVFGCGTANAPPGTQCNDLDSCTTDDLCSAGLCKGSPVVCGDEDPCTFDACVDGGCVSTPIPCEDDDPCTADACVEGACVHTPIPGCGLVACVNQDAGAACDDGDAATTGDLCLQGYCLGFTLTRVPAATVPGQAGLAISEVDQVGDAWWAVFWTVDDDYDPAYSIVEITDPADPAVAYTGSSALRGLRHGFVGDQAGRLRTAATGWSTSNVWDSGLGDSERGVIRSLWANPGRSALWVVGQSGSDDWLRYCARSGQQVACAKQELDDFQPSSIPRAIAGLEHACAPGVDACDSRVLVVGADGPSGQASGGYFKDAYENVGGTDEVWAQSYIPQSPSADVTVTATAWGDGDFLLAGTGGFMRHRRPDGSWSSNLLDILGGMTQRTFTGAWAGHGVVALSAYRVADGQAKWELWTCPQSKSVEVGSNWTIHLLGSGPNSDTVGLYDVRGGAGGELRAVGAALSGDGAPWLDGLVFIRAAAGIP